jgi:hypothetical protein
MSELQTKIKAWLDEQGYPLEMRVARAFRKAGFKVFQSEYYHDPSSQILRETDVVAYMQHEIEGAFVRVEFIVECKQARSKPWLMFCSPDLRLAAPGRVAQRVHSKLASRVMRCLADRREVQDLDLFSVVQPPAYGATQAFTTGSDVVYSALTSVSAAAAAEAATDEVYVILFPVVVMEGKLFSCVLQEDASVAVSESSVGTLLWRNPMAGMPHTIVSILSDAFLDQFVRTASNSVNQFFALAHDEFARAIKSSKSAERPRVVASARRAGKRRSTSPP